MKVTYTDPEGLPDDLAGCVESSITYTWGGGATEQATVVASKAAEAIGKLVNMLADNGAITPGQAAEFLDFRWQNGKFTIQP